MRPEITIERTPLNEVEYVPCDHCRGRGRVPGRNAGAVLCGERERARVSRRLVARAMDISEGHLRDMERGNRNWSNEQVERFRAALRSLKNS